MAGSKSKLFLSFVLGVCLAASGFVAVLYVQLKDISNLEDLVAQELSDRTHRKVKIGSAHLDYKNGVRIRLQDLTLEDPASGQVVFAAGKVWLSVRPLALLNREIKIRNITLERAVFQVLRDRQGNFHFSSFNAVSVPPTASAEWQADDFSFWIKAGLVHEMTLRQGELHFVDHFVTAGAEPIVTHVTNLSFAISQPFLNSSLKYTLEGDLQGHGELPAQINLFGTIQVPSPLENLSQVAYEGKVEVQGIPLDDWQPYWDHWAVRLPAQHQVSLDSKFSGTLGGQFKISGQLEHALGSPQGPPVFSDAAQPARGVLDFNLIRVDDTVELKQLSYRGGEWGLDITAVFSELTGDRPKVSWTLATEKFSVANSERYFPLQLLPEKFLEKIHQFLVQGDVEIRSLEFDGFLDELTGEVSLETLRRFSGDLVLYQAELERRISGLQGVDGTLSLKQGLVDIKITRARYHGIPVQNLRASLNPFRQPAWIEGALESQFDLQTLKNLWLREGSPGVVLNLLGSAVNLQGMARTQVRFQGPLDRPGNLALQGKGVVEGVGWESTAIPWPVANVTGNFEFKSPGSGIATNLKKNPDGFWEVQFHKVSGEFGVHEIRDFDGSLVIDGEASSKRFKGKILLSYIRADELLPVSSEGRFQSIIKQVFALGGEIDVDYQSSFNPKATPMVVTKGVLHINEMTLLHTGGYRPLQRLSADVIFDEDKIILETRQGWYGESAIQIHGNFLNYKTSHPKLILKGVAPDFKHEDFEGVPFLDRFEYRGPARMEFTINCTEEYFKFKNRLDLTRASYEVEDFLVKPANVANSIEVFAEIKPEGLEFKNLVFTLGGIRISGNGSLNGFEDPEFTVQLASKNLNAREAARYIKPLAGAEGGTADFQLAGKGHFNRLDSAEFKGWISLRDVEYQHENLLHPFTLNAQLRFINNQFEIQSASLVSDHTRLQIQGTYVRGPEPSLKLALAGTSLYPVDFISKSEERAGGLMSWLGDSDWFMKGSGEVAVKLDHFYYEPWRWNNVTGRIFFKKGVLETKNLKIGDSGKNRVRWDARLSLADPENPKFKTSVAAWEISAEGFGDIFGDVFYKAISGKMRKFRAEAQGQGKTWKEIALTLNGKVSLRLENGTVHTGRLLNGMQKLFGLPANPQVAADRLREPDKLYQEITGDFVVIGGRAHTENFIYDDVQKKISLVGQFDLGNNTMDIVVGVAPLRGLDKFLTQIPLVGGIITGGEEESLVKNYYTVTGPFEDPKTTPVPLTSLGKKVVGIFQGIVQAPEKMFPLSE